MGITNYVFPFTLLNTFLILVLIQLFDVDRDISDSTNDGETRLSWHLNEQNHGGYRCGTTTSLQHSNSGGDDWEKVFYHAN